MPHHSDGNHAGPKVDHRTESNAKASKSLLRVALLLIILSSSLVVAGGVFILLIASDPANADSYVRLLGTLLSWPVLAFALVLVLLVAFYRQLEQAADEGIESVGRDGIRFRNRQPSDPNARELNIPRDDESGTPPAITDQTSRDDPGATSARGTDPSDDGPRSTPNGGSANTPYDSNREVNDAIRSAYMRGLRQRNAALKDEATYWWQRFLTVFLTPTTRTVLQSLALLVYTGEHWTGSGDPAEHERRGEYDTIQLYLSDGRIHKMRKSEFQAELRELSRFGLVESDEDYVITPLGHQLVAFWATSDGRELISRISNEH